MRLIWVHQTGHFQKGSLHVCKPAELNSYREINNLQKLERSFIPLDYILKIMFIGFWIGLTFLEILRSAKNAVNFVWDPTPGDTA